MLIWGTAGVLGRKWFLSLVTPISRMERQVWTSCMRQSRIHLLTESFPLNIIFFFKLTNWRVKEKLIRTWLFYSANTDTDHSVQVETRREC